MADRVLVALEEIGLVLGTKRLFDGLSLHIAEGEKICLIGRNGAGKTTLMRLIMQELELDAGKRFQLPGCRIGYLAQQVHFDPEQKVREFVQLGLPEKERGAESLHRADIVLSPLNLDPDAPMGHLSGGQVRRAALAQAIVAEPDVLLLDEPTNHLDLTAIEWLEQYLARSSCAVVCVSHDRTFLSAFSKKVFWIDQGRVRTCPTGYAGFDEWQEQVTEQEARTLANMQKKMAQEEQWMQGGISARRKRNQRRLNELHRLREKIRIDKEALKKKQATIEGDPLVATAGSKIVAEFKGVTKRFTRDGKHLRILDDFSLKIIKGDRIGILGKNGSGKSTFLKLLIGELEPDTGRVFRSKKMELAYFDQHRSSLDPKKTLWKTLAPNSDYVFFGSGEKKRHKHVAAYLKDFMFDPKRAKDDVGTLSGGMQNRLMLAKTLINPGNIMILDEPTNDLDMDTLDMLQGILADYEGTLIIVSHDRDFLDRTVTEVLAFEGQGKVESYFGGYSDYIHATQGRAAAPTKAASKPATRKEAAPAAPAGLTFAQADELKKLPGKITALEQKIRELTVAMEDAELYTKAPEQFDQIMKALPKLQQQLADMEQRWLVLEGLSG
jgi:ATP-binding cassette subfamily F protein uup